VTHGDAVSDGDRGELARSTAGRRDAFFGRLGLARERDVAGRRFVPGGDDADQRLRELRLAHTHGIEKGPVRRAFGTLGDMTTGQPGLFDTLVLNTFEHWILPWSATTSATKAKRLRQASS
jgi:hypothetical protein